MNGMMLSFFRFMWSISLLPDLIREARWWSLPASSGCPWGGILLVVVCTFGCGCICGACLGVVVISRTCRDFLVRLFGALVVSFHPSVDCFQQGPLELRRRFQQYRA